MCNIRNKQFHYFNIVYFKKKETREKNGYCMCIFFTFDVIMRSFTNVENTNTKTVKIRMRSTERNTGLFLEWET
jgi:hypothetical protein